MMSRNRATWTNADKRLGDSEFLNQNRTRELATRESGCGLRNRRRLRTEGKEEDIGVANSHFGDLAIYRDADFIEFPAERLKGEFDVKVVDGNESI